MNAADVRKTVREGYGRIARERESCCSSETSCCGPVASCCGGPTSAEELSRRIGYSDEEMDAVPEGANLGLGCGNPVALASLREGETVLDLGSGAGFDCFLAARAVGEAGRVIGVDMTPDMLERARSNADKGGHANVEFRLGEIENLPVADGLVDAIISNCVINLSPDKPRVFSEAFRVLAPGGRLMVSDIVLLKGLPEPVRESAEAYVGCLSGAMLKDDYLGAIANAGFEGIEVLSETPFHIDLAPNDPTVQSVARGLDPSEGELEDLANSAVSVSVVARKPQDA